MKLMTIAGASLLALTKVAGAQAVCSSYMGQTVAPQRADTLVAAFSKLPVKNEFETTAAFTARRNAALSPRNTPIVVAVPPQRDAGFVYDADNQSLQVKAVAFGGHILQPSAISVAAPNMPPHGIHNIDAELDSTTQVTGSYVGQNAFGAKFKVTKQNIKSLAIFDREDPKSFLTDYRVNYLFDTVDGKHNIVGSIAMPPTEALAVKSHLKTALVIEPKEPFLIQGSYSLGDITPDSPYDSTDYFSILVANIHCGLVLDSSNKVIASYKSRSSTLLSPASRLKDGLEPMARTQTLPPYPTISLRLGEQGVTELDVTVNTEGSAEDVTIKKSSGSARLDQAAAEYVRGHWRWKPPPRVSITTATVTWDLKNAQ